MRENAREKIYFSTLGIPLIICMLAFFWIVYTLSTGATTLSWDLVTRSALQGGMFEMIIGTIYLLGGAAIIAGPIGVLAAVYLVEYAPNGRLTHIIDQAINNLAGVPSVVVGLFGFTFFARQIGLGISLLTGWLTLALMMLPIVIRGSEEAIKMIPPSFKEAALGLGATKWKSISSMTLSAAFPGIVTSVILGMARIAGETAAILFTSCVFITRGLPKSPLEPVMSLAYNLFIQITVVGERSQVIFGMALILFSIITSFALVAIILRTYYRRRQLWLR